MHCSSLPYLSYVIIVYKNVCLVRLVTYVPKKLVNYVQVPNFIINCGLGVDTHS